MLNNNRHSWSRREIKNVLAAMAVGVAVAACGGTAASTPPKPNTVTMTAQNGSGVSGTAEVVKANASFTLTVKLTGMTPGSIHVSHVHAGGCSHPGGIVYKLTSVVADSSGVATTTTIVPAEYLVPASGWYVNIHFGPDFTEAEYAPSISCGDLQAA
ncbi:MAG TPA: CHRD domain-containing protein [Candidatus Dormibacteraeota bacterium]